MLIKNNTKIGRIKINTKSIIITDPGYDHDIGEYTRRPITPGMYIYKIVKEKDTENSRNKSLILIKEDETTNYFNEITTVGVDAGLIGMFESKPDYDDVQWSNLCTHIFDSDKDHIDKESFIAKETNPFMCNGICCTSGYGDGEYSVYEILNKNKEIIGYSIKLI